MPTISAKIIIPQKNRRCESYAHWGRKDDLMPKGEPQMRLYGNGRNPDPKYTMYICLECAKQSHDPKIKKALEHGKTIVTEKNGTNK